MIRTGFYIILIVYVHFCGFSQQNVPIKVTNEKSCLGFISILGNTNVNDFEFEMDFSKLTNYEVVDVLQRKKSGDLDLVIPVKEFESKNSLMRKDFLEFIQAEKYPFIKIQIPYKQLQGFISGNNNILFNIKITIAGVTRNYTVNGKVNTCPEGNLIVNGRETIKLSEFNLTPPQKWVD
ncbi:MAG: YceI family protein [Bacteroidales bacterium]|nr:YceI family protein [Bacteroidales bacterium]